MTHTSIAIPLFALLFSALHDFPSHSPHLLESPGLLPKGFLSVTVMSLASEYLPLLSLSLLGLRLHL